MPPRPSGVTRRHSTITEPASLRPTPPASARLSDISNTSGDAFQKLNKAVADKSAEVSRLSAKTLELMGALAARDEEGRRMEVALEAARRERANLQQQLAAHKESGRATAPAASAPTGVGNAPKRSASASSTSVPASPQRNSVVVKVLRAALQDADAATALRSEELAAARAMLGRDKPASAPVMNTGGVPPAAGTVSRLQAELLEAAEERRAARAQQHSLRERCRELEAQLAERASQLTQAGRARQQLADQLAAASASGEESRRSGAEARTALKAQNVAEARALDLERRLALAQVRIRAL